MVNVERAPILGRSSGDTVDEKLGSFELALVRGGRGESLGSWNALMMALPN